jgi:quinol monooxygenase YgiN
MNSCDKQQILRQIAAIAAMERGKLSAFSFEDRPGASGPYYRLQHWENGKNHTRHVRAEDLAAVQAAVDGYAQYRQLTEQYADLVVAETRQNLAGSKKNSVRRRSSSLRRRKSDN